MNIKLKNFVIRSWREEDAESLAYHANNRKIWINLRDAFPHPYTLLMQTNLSNPLNQKTLKHYSVSQKIMKPLEV